MINPKPYIIGGLVTVAAGAICFSVGNYLAESKYKQQIQNKQKEITSLNNQLTEQEEEAWKQRFGDSLIIDSYQKEVTQLGGNVSKLEKKLAKKPKVVTKIRLIENANAAFIEGRISSEEWLKLKGLKNEK